MPLLIHKEIESKLELGLWKIIETEAWFRDRLSLHPEEADQLNQIKGEKRRLEWLASRQLVHHMSGRKERSPFLKDEFGKPHLDDSPYQISISHSHGTTAAIAGPLAVGIDIQLLVSKINRIAHRFLNSEEQASLSTKFSLHHLHVFWGAKEALYKAYGRRALDFCQHILVKPFQYNPHIGICQGEVIKDDYRAQFEIHYELVLENYMLVFVWEKEL